MKRAMGGLAGALLLMAGVAVVRAVRWRAPEISVPPVTAFAVPPDVAAGHLAAALRFATISDLDPAKVNPQPFEQLRAYLEQTYPRVHSALTRELVNGRSLLYTWKGSDPSLAPYLFIAHQDVVPVEPGTEQSWAEPPFAGHISQGFIWGRGAIDDKGYLIGLMEAAEALLAQGFQPRRTIYFAFGHDEEVSGVEGAQHISALLESRGVKVEAAFDEGLVVTDGIVPGVRGLVALVGVAEKGYATVQLTAQAEGGHSSMPPPHTAVGLLAAAVERVENHPMSARLAGAARRSFETLGAQMGFSSRLALANLWLTEPLVLRQLTASPATNAMLRTTAAATRIDGGVKDNVLPSRAQASINFRILPGDTVASVLEHVRRVVSDDRVHAELVGPRSEPSAESRTDTPAFQAIDHTVREVFPGAVVAESIVMGGTDSRHFANVTQRVYRFQPLRMRPEDTARPHGSNERVGIEDFARAVTYDVQLMKRLAQ